MAERQCASMETSFPDPSVSLEWQTAHVPDPLKSAFMNMASGLPLLPDGVVTKVGGGVGGNAVGGGSVGLGKVRVGGSGVGVGGTGVAVGGALLQEEISAIAGSTT